MKNRSLFFVFIYILIFNIAKAQTTYIPDDIFEQTLIELGYDSGPLDNYTNTTNLEKITYLDISNKNIKNLSGLEDFKNLQVLVYNSSHTKIDNVSCKIDFKYRNAIFTLIDTATYQNKSAYNNIVFSMNITNH